MLLVIADLVGVIISPPEPAVVPLGSIATFTCVATGNIVWSINSRLVVNQVIVDAFAKLSGVFVPLPTLNHSVVTINATLQNNGTNVQCLVEDMKGFLLNRSEAVQLLVTTGMFTQFISLSSTYVTVLLFKMSNLI